MGTVTVWLAQAMICFGGVCHHALVGRATPVGRFTLQRIAVSAKGYGGDVLMFQHRDGYIWAIHRTWTRSPWQHRRARLASDDAGRRHITMGCINVAPPVYAALVKCCAADQLEVRP